MRCPTCKNESPAASPYAPFCSDRCRLIDLGNWASGKYVISTPIDPSTAESVPERRENESEDATYEH